MALKKENYETIYGTKAEHWVIQSINVNDPYGYADIPLAGYLNLASYEPGKASIATTKVKVSYTNGFEEHFSKKAVVASSINEPTNIYKQAYEYIKNNNEFFKDAIDC